MLVGVLALQGAFDAHVQRLTDLGIESRLVKDVSDLEDLDGIILPGGESTTMSNLLVASGLGVGLSQRLHDGLPVFGTCAGMIMMARTIQGGRPDQISLDAMDIHVRRNGYGRQNDSFEQDISISSLDSPFHALFIRAPIIESIGKDVEVLASIDANPVLVRQAHTLASSFHPELVSDLRVHEIFLSIIHESLTTSKR
ncbi:MAG: pyridoxal 5'-phosphate synthase glutaminase subunit PdxT [Actinobacteria bacterium]|nr:pyridoxal 5'-phosphate synthase glutaminase subunit PdxT [Actinomycetota bacterium]MSX15484.1 pyridoxal 5'-phosphate synthase glutaminase subunit PdxT [Actinomycetota bacterium]MSX35930.1 pyridoxal 5'-phosphate synthase glutaminase subunit PdxT [Actinomycetota bacterium]MSX76409.1 pyridoxal 5'-phosphate synthase glutaminase subunit PdxT [Actinomycetota bacterium]MSZ70706.1 pyridoxal 5'-phosphate synthase glutaminase subunit PdxT [Actinomycetota bacterium]